MKRSRIFTALIILAAVMMFAFTGCSKVTLKPGVHITEAYHYYPDGTRCHCMVVAGLFDDKPYLDAHDFRIENSNGQTCTLVFKIGDSDTLYCMDNYPLSNLNY